MKIKKMNGFAINHFSNKEFGSFLATRRVPLLKQELHTLKYKNKKNPILSEQVQNPIEKS
jgi:hypothetical protein